MERRDKVITAVKIAAVLIVACLVGLLIRQVRISHLRQEAAAKQKALAEKAIAQQSPGGRRPIDDQKRRAELQKQAVETFNQMSEEEKAKVVRDEVRSRMGASGRPATPPRPGRTRVPMQSSTAPVAPEPNKTTDGKQ